MKKYYKNKDSKEIYYIGKDQKNMDNLINMKSGSEYCLPGFLWDEWNRIRQRFDEISKSDALKEIPHPYGNHN